MIIPLNMPKAHAAGIFNGLASNKEVTAQILCGGLFCVTGAKRIFASLAVFAEGFPWTGEAVTAGD